MKNVWIVVAVLALLPTTSAVAASGDPQQKHTPAGTLLATTVLLRTADLGTGWKAASRSNGAQQECDAVLQPNESDLVEIGKTVGPVFTHGTTEALTQTAHVFATETQANAAWSRTVTKKLVLCMEQQTENTSGMGSPVSVTQWARLQPPRIAGRVAEFRVVAKAKTGKKTWSKVYFDLLLVGHAKTMTKIVFSSLGTPFGTSFEQKLTRIVSDRLTAG